MNTNIRNRAETFGKVALILSGYILASLLLSVGLEVLNNGDILHMCNTFSEAYGGNVMFYDSLGLPEQDLVMPGVKCPTCAARGIEQWVLPGKHCPRCSTAC